MQKVFATFMKTERGFAPILLLIPILILAALGGTYYFIKNQPTVSQDDLNSPSLSDTWKNDKIPQPIPVDETNNWKTYENNTYKYSFALPPNWLFAENSPDDFKGFFDRQAKTPQEVRGTITGAVVVNKKPSAYVTNKDYFNNIYNQTNLEPGITIKKLSIDGERAIMLTEIGESKTILEGKEGIRVIIYHQGDVFEIGITGRKESIEKTKDIFNQILSTFKFTN